MIGLIPGAGDAVGAVLGAAILSTAVRAGVSRFTLLRMAGNVAIDAIVGVVPILGDLFDAAWKANLRNVVLLDRHLATPDTAHRADRLAVGAVMVALGAIIAMTAFASVWLTVTLLRAIGGAIG